MLLIERAARVMKIRRYPRLVPKKFEDRRDSQASLFKKLVEFRAIERANLSRLTARSVECIGDLTVSVQRNTKRV